VLKLGVNLGVFWFTTLWPFGMKNLEFLFAISVVSKLAGLTCFDFGRAHRDMEFSKPKIYVEIDKVAIGKKELYKKCREMFLVGHVLVSRTGD